MRCVARHGRVVAALVSSLALASSAALADPPASFQSIVYETPVPGARADSPGQVRTVVSVQGDGTVKVELAAGAKVLATSTGKAGAEDVARLAKSLAQAKLANAPVNGPAGGSTYVLSWSAAGKQGVTRGPVPHHEPGEGSLAPLVLALRRIEGRVVWGETGSSPISANAQVVQGIVGLEGDKVVVSDPRHGKVVLADTNQSGSLAYYLRHDKGQHVKAIGKLEKGVLEIEATESTLGKDTDLFLFAIDSAWPYSVKLAKGTRVTVRASIADADGNDYDWLDVAGGLQGYVLRNHVAVTSKPSPGLSNSVPNHP